jgi:hypothetical protein
MDALLPMTCAIVLAMGEQGTTATHVHNIQASGKTTMIHREIADCDYSVAAQPDTILATTKASEFNPC